MQQTRRSAQFEWVASTDERLSGLMRIGLALPTSGPLSLSPGVVALAQMGEAAGADTLWTADHLCVPRERSARYPYSPDGDLPFDEFAPWFDCLTVLAAAAVATESIGLGTAVLVLPQRNPLEVAKVAASLDHISNGRLRLGLGAGWFTDEIRALGFQPEGRGRRFDEGVEVMRDCWGGVTRGFAGKHVSVPRDVIFEPTPMRGSVPLLIGGMSERALRRAATLGEGWIADVAVETFDPSALADMKRTVDSLRAGGPRAREPFDHVLVIDCQPWEGVELPGIVREAERLGFDEVVVEASYDEPDALHRLVRTLRAALRAG